MNRVLANRYYYLDNFETVLRWIAQRYDDLLAQPERDFRCDSHGESCPLAKGFYDRLPSA